MTIMNKSEILTHQSGVPFLVIPQFVDFSNLYDMVHYFTLSLMWLTTNNLDLYIVKHVCTPEPDFTK